MNQILDLAERVAATPSKTTAGAFRKEAKRLYNASDQFSYDAKVVADPAAKHIMDATFHLAASMLKAGETASLYEKGKIAGAEEKTQRVLRFALWAIGEVLQAAPEGQENALVSLVRQGLEAGRKATAARTDEEQQLHVLQPVHLEDRKILT